MFPTPGNSPPYTTNDGKQETKGICMCECVLGESKKVMESESKRASTGEKSEKEREKRRGGVHTVYVAVLVVSKHAKPRLCTNVAKLETKHQ